MSAGDSVHSRSIARPATAASDLELQLQPLTDQESPGFPGMKWSAVAEEDPDRQDVWLVRLDVRWLEEGEFVQERFLRVLPRQLPLGARVRRFRDEHGITTR